MDVPLEDPKLWDVDEIALVDDFEGRYVSDVTKPGTFIWNEATKREVVMPTFKWRIGDKWYAAVVPIDFDERGNEEPFCVSLRLRGLIEKSRAL